MKGNILILFLLALGSMLHSCGSGDVVHPSQISDDIAGEYLFKYPTGQIERVIIKSDSTYNQYIYLNEINYKNDSCLYSNSGSWFVVDKKINFNDWLMYNYLRNPDSILVSPQRTTLMDVYWYDKSKKRVSLLSVFSDNGYVFKKLD
ncbi:MAG: hypothetical protein KDD41_09265 [Flavobacteriales bacterium]|nr:hypothetical protein [Flavobacteriales bacterium]